MMIMFTSLLKTGINLLVLGGFGLASIAVYDRHVNPSSGERGRAALLPATFDDRPDIKRKLAENQKRADELAKQEAEKARANPPKVIPGDGSVRKLPPAC